MEIKCLSLEVEYKKTSDLNSFRNVTCRLSKQRHDTRWKSVLDIIRRRLRQGHTLCDEH